MSMKRVLTVFIMSVMLSGFFGVSVQAEESMNAVQNITTGTEVQGKTDAPAEQTVVKKQSTTDVTKKSSKVKSKASVLKGKKEKAYTKSELRLMSAIIYCEAGNEPYAGKKAVGIVVMNRKRSKKFPDTIKGVIYQKGQFQPARSGALKKALKAYDQGKFETAEYKSCVKAAKEALNGDTKVKVKGKTHNMKSYLFFSQYVKGCRLKIGGHQFK